MKLFDTNPFKLDWAYVFIMVTFAGIFFMRSGWDRHKDTDRPTYLFWQWRKSLTVIVAPVDQGPEGC